MEELKSLIEIMSLKSSRHFVIELSVIIEELVSDTLGKLLNIDWENSKSLGYKSESISFNQKVNLIKDINGIENEFKKKLVVFMRIRNKFAHVKSISSFEELFAKSENDIFNSLNNWYESNSIENFEKKYRDIFQSLFFEIHKTLIENIQLQHLVKEAVKQTEIDFKSKFLNILKEDVKFSEEANAIWNMALLKVNENN